MEKFAQAGSMDAVTCPACGLLCDDLVIDRDATGNLKVIDKGCAKSIAFFQRPRHEAAARIQGKPADLQSAIKRVAQILRNANQPVIAGLGTEVQGMRAIMSLADRTGATLDHMNSNAGIRNTQVLQNSGWHATTLTEARNRMDFLLVIGTDIASHNPRFFERIVWKTESMFGQDTSAREVVYLGGRNLDTTHGVSLKGVLPVALPCDIESLPEVIAVLHALIRGKELVVKTVAGIAVADLEKLARRLKAANYSVITWAPGILDFPHAELAIQHITGLIAELNKTTRSSVLPLGGSDGDTSTNQVSTWISGYPVRNSFMHQYPEYDPHHFSVEQQLNNEDADALLWISAFSPERLPPSTDIPTVVIGHSNMKLKSEPDVFIPIGTPGIDHAGTMFRIDNVVSLPLRQLRDSNLPSLTEIISNIESNLDAN